MQVFSDLMLDEGDTVEAGRGKGGDRWHVRLGGFGGPTVFLPPSCSEAAAMRLQDALRECCGHPVAAEAPADRVAA